MGVCQNNIHAESFHLLRQKDAVDNCNRIMDWGFFMDGKKVLKSVCIGVVFGALFAVFIIRDEGVLRLCSNAAFFGGILLLVYALFEWTLFLGFYNGVTYTFKKIWEAITSKNYDPKKSKLKSRPEYENTHSKGKVCKEQFVAAALLLLVSIVSACFC